MVGKLKKRCSISWTPASVLVGMVGARVMLLTLTLTAHFLLKHLEDPTAYARLTFMDFISAFNTILTVALRCKSQQQKRKHNSKSENTHILFDQFEESRLGKDSFGSTKSGIAPFYSDKYLKIGIQVAEMYDDETLMKRLVNVCETKNQTFRSLYNSDYVLNPQTLFDELISYRERLKPMVTNTAYFLHDAIKQDKNILLEGQLGALKDTDNGIYPFVTSSSPLAGFATVGAGIPPHKITKVVTVVKAYSSAVGAGAFVSEIFGADADTLRRLGGDMGEYGATTGRARRMGWFDCVASKYGCMLQGTTDVAFSLIDVLGYLDKIPVCVAYEVDGERTTIFPNTVDLNRAKPVIEYVDGWKCDISGINKYDELPIQARNYIEFVEKHLEFPITMISNGPKRNDIIFR